MNSRIRWACRRGMLELDLILLPFFDQYFDTMSSEKQAIFEQMLTAPDPDLFQWVMGYAVPDEKLVAELVELIRLNMSIPKPVSSKRVSRSDG